jgi:hypothetical protein
MSALKNERPTLPIPTILSPGLTAPLWKLTLTQREDTRSLLKAQIVTLPVGYQALGTFLPAIRRGQRCGLSNGRTDFG